MNDTILVMGSTGTIGSEVVKALLERGVKVRVGVRDLKKVQNKPWIKNVETTLLDYDQPETIKTALTNVDKLFLVTAPGFHNEGIVTKSILKYCGDIKHITRLSGLGADNHNIFANHGQADAFLKSSGINYTSLRANAFMQNFYKYQSDIKQQNQITGPAENGKMSYIDARDIAAVAAVTLTESGHENKIYDLTGGQAFDNTQAAKIFSEVLGRDITFDGLSAQEFISQKEAEGMPAEFAERFVQFFRRVQKGEYEKISPAVEEILGRPPISLQQFVGDYREEFI